MEIPVKQQLPLQPVDWRKSCLWVALAVACFHMAYTSLNHPVLGLFIFGYAYALVRLVDQASVKRAFYFGLVTGYLCYAPQAFFMWRIFNVASVVLWLVLAFWTGLFAAIVCGCIRRWGKAKAMWLVPVVWTGVEYFRSELYVLKFSWLNIGYALPPWFNGAGMYGIGFLIFLGIAAIPISWRIIQFTPIRIALYLVLLTLSINPLLSPGQKYAGRTVFLVGVQLEFPPEGILPKVLSQALAKNTNADIFVLSEYTLNSGVPEALKDWCRDNQKYLVIGGEDIVTNSLYYNTVFVVGTNGDIVFKQAKSVPIQFFRDGLPATKQELWDSPWGEIGICICYDLSYTRVTDELVRQGAQLLIVPTMDVESWGRHQHELHARVAPVRAAEYGVPIFRLASSGISQVVNWHGAVIAQTKMGGNGEVMAAQLRMSRHGALPWDRVLAPVCTGMTVVVVILLLWGWKRKMTKSLRTAAGEHSTPDI
ncbi:MAG: hypothetical protein JF609_09030 [Verrucomicrobia bacterium]|nr:hypothetical protein [Verrucomicrobiota bacterium]